MIIFTNDNLWDKILCISESGEHSDPDNSGQCINCKLIFEEVTEDYLEGYYEAMDRW